MPIRLTNLEQIPPQRTVDNKKPAISPEDTFLYKDVAFDLKLGDIYGNIPVNRYTNISDIEDIRDIEDIKQSLHNLFNTKPGQRLTNPFFGLDLSGFLFDPISEIVANTIGRTIQQGVRQWEPRVILDSLRVIGIPPQTLYEITFGLSFADNRLHTIGLQANVSTTGFAFTKIL